jgi:hypothetical protein
MSKRLSGMKTGPVLRAVLMGAAVMLGGSVWAPSARADTVTLFISQGNAAIAAFPGPYASVTVNRIDSDDATITFNSLTAAGNIYLMGSDVGVNVNDNGLPGTNWTVVCCTASNSGTGFTNLSTDYSDGGAKANVSAFGGFNQTINIFDGFSHSVDTLSFDLHLTSGSWANAASVLTTNSDGFAAYAHIFVTGSPAVQSAGAIATGFAAVPGPIVGAGLPGLVMACGGLLALARRRRQKSA